MEGKVTGHAQIIFPVHIQPGHRVGTWQATLDEPAGPTVIDFMSALELLRWLENAERGSLPADRGLR